jgi:membrane-bound ClpP family serine protease
LDPEGFVLVDGARWKAQTGGARIEDGDKVVVTEIEGLTLTVDKPDEEEREDS